MFTAFHIFITTSVEELQHFYAAPAPAENLNAAPAFFF
jgi:hypothetical protein